MLAKCNILIESARKIIESAPENNKTWLSLYVNLANMLPDVRAAGFGLDLPQERGAALERLMAIEKELVELQSNSSKPLITNATKRKLGCDSFDSVPLQADFNQYVPSLIPVFDSFKRMMQSDKAALTKEVVHAAVATEYPKPVLK